MSTAKNTIIHVDRVTLLHIQQHPSVLEAVKTTKSSRVVELSNAAEILPTVALKKRQGTESDNTYATEEH